LSIDSKEKAFKIYKVLDDKKAIDIKIIYIGDLTTIADYFIIATANSQPHLNTLADEIEEKLFKDDIPVNHIEGYKSTGWILMDYGDVVVHLFLKEDRFFYNLERLWKDGKEVVLDKQM